jgi:hypothetical protein
MSAVAGPLLLAIGALAALAIGLQYPLWSDGSLGSGLMPAIGAGLVLVASVAGVLTGGRETFERQKAAKVAGYLAALIVLPFAITALGMLPALALFALAILVLVERMRAKRALVIVGASLAFNWLVFERLLQVSLPRAILW